MSMLSGVTTGLIGVLQILPALLATGGAILAILLALNHFIWKPKKFPVITLLYERIGERPIFVGMDNAGQKKVPSGTIEYKLMRRKNERILPVQYNFLIPSKSGKLVACLLKTGDNAWIPLEISSMGDMLNFRPVEADMRNWHLQINHELILKYTKPTWWQENKSAVLFIMAIMGTIVIYYMMWTYAPQTISTAHSVAQEQSNNIVSTVKNAINPSGAPI